MPKSVAAADAGRAAADLVGIEPLSGGAAADHARALPELLQLLQLVGGRRHLAAAARASGRRRRCRSARWCSAPRSQIIDEQHRPVPPARSARSAIAAAASPTSYYRNPEESAVAFRDGWYYPGDLGRFDADGFLYLTGRAKDMIIRGGVNIYPAEIEQTLVAHPAVAEAAVVGWPSQERGEEVAAFVVCRAQRDRAGSDRALPRVAGALQDPEGVFFLDAVAEERPGQGAQAGAGRAAAAAGVTGRRLRRPDSASGSGISAGCQLTSFTEPSADGVNTASTARPALSRSRVQFTRLPTMRTPLASSSSTSTTA